MQYKLFFVSDIHNGYPFLIEALKKAGFDENNESHLLVCLGDWNDRLSYALATYQYLKHLTDIGRGIVLLGNHGLFLLEFLEGSDRPFNYIHNGLDHTIADFWHRTVPFESWCMLDAKCEINNENYAKWAKICRNDINKEYPELLPWLKSLPRYFESKNYIGVHGAIDTDAQDWHNPNCSRQYLKDWDALDFDDGSFLSKPNTTGKTIVVGHFGTGDLRERYNLGDPNDYSILKTKDNKVFIDGCTVLTKNVNVFVVENEELL
jgi:serine/threonine protein phosphatase 1